MFDEPTSLPMRAAIASLLGSCFGIALILTTHSVHAQETNAEAARAADIARAGGTTLGSLRASNLTSVAYGRPVARGLRVPDASSDSGASLRWQLAPTRSLRGENEAPGATRSDLLTLGMQVRF